MDSIHHLLPLVKGKETSSDQETEELIQRSLEYKLILQMKLDRMMIEGDIPIQTVEEWALVRKSIKT